MGPTQGPGPRIPRFRRHRWALTFDPADGGSPVRRTFPEFRDAVVAARGLALAGRTPVSA